MRTLILVISVTVAWSITSALPDLSWLRPPKASTLRLVHVLFRHGNRNPESTSIWEGNSFSDESYYPEGFGQLTNAGKLTEYNLGKLLRKRYDYFLGDTWNIDSVDFRCTDYNRTKMSGMLVMAGMWPPKGSNIWNKEVSWQPIPYNYVPLADDKLLFPIYSSEFVTALKDVYNSPEIQNYMSERYNKTMEVMAVNTGIDQDDYSTAAGYFDAMEVQRQLGYPLDEWTKQVYPEPLNSLAVDMYYIYTNTTALRKSSAGQLIKKILTDSQDLIDGNLSPSTRKMFVYSAHDINVGMLLLSLEAYKIPHTPPYGSTVIFEVHEIKGEWGLKLFYIDYTKGSPHLLAIPGCGHFCQMDQFKSLVEEIIP